MQCIVSFIHRVCLVGLLVLYQAGCDSDASRPVVGKPMSTPDPAESRTGFANRPLPPELQPELRIRILSRELPIESLDLGTDGQRLLFMDGLDSQLRILRGPIRLSVDERLGWHVLDSLNHQIHIPDPCAISVRTLRDDPAAIQVEGALYPGVLDLVPVDASSSGDESGALQRIDLVTRIQIESYLPGVLDGELYGHWPSDTFRAQAVAARSYAVAESAYWSDRRHFDLTAGPASQVWKGIDC